MGHPERGYDSMTDIAKPPFRDMPPLTNMEKGESRFKPLWEEWFVSARNKINDNTSDLSDHLADVDNPHETSDENILVTDVTNNDVSTSAHGFTPKLPDDATKFFDGTGVYDTVKDSDLSLSDITTNDVSITKHGLVPKAPNDTTKFFRGDATWHTINVVGGEITLNGANFVTVTDTNVTATCRITWGPTNLAAGVLESGASKLYLSNKAVGGSFTLTTSDGVAAPIADHKYDYIILIA